MKYELRENYVILQGDPHGLKYIRAALDVIPEGRDWIVIGDCGVGFDEKNKEGLIKELLLHIDQICYIKNINLYLIRGNHDNPSWWKENKVVLLRTKFVKDYDSFVFPNGKTALAVGGGISIDRCLRGGASYWEDEVTTDPPEGLGEFDFVFAHDCPTEVNHHTNGLEKSFFHFVSQDVDLINDCEKQRATMDKVFFTANPKVYIYGHFHNTHRCEYYGCKFRCLDINELYEFSADE